MAKKKTPYRVSPKSISDKKSIAAFNDRNDVNLPMILATMDN